MTIINDSDSGAKFAVSTNAEVTKINALRDGEASFSNVFDETFIDVEFILVFSLVNETT